MMCELQGTFEYVSVIVIVSCVLRVRSVTVQTVKVGRTTAKVSWLTEIHT